MAVAGAPALRSDAEAQSEATSTGKSAGQTVRSAAAPSSAAGGADSACDLSGPWLLTIHKVTDGLGNLQYVHNYLYYEIEARADGFEVTRSLHCGTDVVGGGAFAITVDYTGAAPGVRKHVSHNGRRATSQHTADGCQVAFDKQYTVMGATLPYYLDPSTTLPNADQEAMDGKPGWEDWDSDGNPGITGVCEGTVTGKIYTAAREWATLSGTVPDVKSLIKLPMLWDQEPNVMAFDGSPFLGSSAVRAADASLHFVQLARLTPEQIAGDDAGICERMVALAKTLTPEAAGM